MDGVETGLYYVSVIAEDDGMLSQPPYRMNRSLEKDLVLESGSSQFLCSSLEHQQWHLYSRQWQIVPPNSMPLGDMARQTSRSDVAPRFDLTDCSLLSERAHIAILYRDI